MYGADRLFAVPSRLVLGGKTYECRGRIMRHYGEMEAEVRRRRQREDPLVVARNGLELFVDKPEFQRQLLEVAMDQATRHKWVTRSELYEWMDTLEGTAFCAWLSIRHNDESLTPESVLRVMLDDMDEATAKLAESMPSDEAGKQAEEQVKHATHEAIRQASGSDTAGNLTGPPLSQVGAGGTISQSPGDDGPDSSDKSTASASTSSAE